MFGRPAARGFSLTEGLMTIESANTRWLILAMLFACRTCLGFQFQTLGSVSISLVDQLGFNYAEIGTLIGFFMLPGLVLSLPVGYAGRYLADRTLVALGLSVLALGGALAAVAQGFGLLALGRIAAGAGFVVSTIYFTKMVADWFTGRELATAMGVLVASWPVGIAMGQIGHVWIAANVDWRMAFVVAAVYCVVGAVAVRLCYRAPPRAPGAAATPVAVAFDLPRNELVLTLLAASVWGMFNAGYIVYLSFAPRVLMVGGYDATQAAAVISIASWVMIFSIGIGGQIADRTGKRDLVIYAGAATAVVSLLLLHEVSIAVWLSLAFGLVGMASAGVIMALTGEAMAPQRRAFGMGVFFSGYFVIMTAAPPIAGWLYDRGGDPYVSVQFAAALFVGAALANWAFRLVKKRIAA
jgi:predicted MFS family arabinose efflux permease